MPKQRLDQLLANRGLASSRSQAESLIKLGFVTVNGEIIKKPGKEFDKNSEVKVTAPKKYVSRAAFKLDSACKELDIDFTDKTVLDVGSSTGGFTEYALEHGASIVIAVELGTNQMHNSLRDNPRIELYEQTDIRSINNLSKKVDIVLIDVSFISLREILPHISKLISQDTLVLAMVKPQFEAPSSHKHKGVIKNNKIRREILKGFEQWVISKYKIVAKADSKVAGEKGNLERFYSLRLVKG